MSEQQRNENTATALETRAVGHAELTDEALETVSGGIIIIGGLPPLAYATYATFAARPAAY